MSWSDFREQALPRLFACVPVRAWHRLAHVKLVLPYWHVVSDAELDHVSGLYSFRNTRQFRADLEFFCRHYQPVSLGDIIKHLDGFGSLPKRCFLPTFDDGFREASEVIAPILSELGVPGVFFLITSAVDNRQLCPPQVKSLLLRALNKQRDSAGEREAAKLLAQASAVGVDLAARIVGLRYHQNPLLTELAQLLGCDLQGYLAAAKPYLTTEQIHGLLRRGFAIGAHSLDHPRYTELPLPEQLRQTQASLAWLTERFQPPCVSFAFPYTDAGVSADFFLKTFDEGKLKVTFGSGGMKPRSFARHLPRFSMERTSLPANCIVARHYAKACLRRD